MTEIPRYGELCYTLNMHADQHMWREWIATIHRWGLQEWIAHFLEAAGSLTILGAQVVYISQPLIESSLPDGQLETFARMLEDPMRTKTFIHLLREETQI